MRLLSTLRRIRACEGEAAAQLVFEHALREAQGDIDVEKPMTPTLLKQFNRMRVALKRIVAYQTPDQLRRNAERDYGLDANEAIEYAYENIQQEAKRAVAGVREVKAKVA